MTLTEVKDKVEEILVNDIDRPIDIYQTELEIQRETLEIATIISKLQPHTLLPPPLFPIRENSGTSGMELSADGRIFILFATGQARQLTEQCIQNDPAVLDQFRALLPKFLESYIKRYDAKLRTLAEALACLKTFKNISISYLKT